jgi:hypothetical protein
VVDGFAVVDPNVRQGSTLLDFLIDVAYKGKSPIGWQPEQLTYPIFMFNFPGIHASGIQGASFFLDLLSTPPRETVLEILRQEVQTISDHCQGTWTTEDLDNAVLLDSAIKESLRLNGLSAIAPARKVQFSPLFFLFYESLHTELLTRFGILLQVVDINGVTLPNGLHLPHGTTVGIPQLAIHRDPEFYPNPEEYQPWRFYQHSEAASAEKQRQNVSNMTTTSDTYLAFGHGRRPCPGRFIFTHVFKLLTAEILLNYDIKPIPSRPKVNRKYIHTSIHTIGSLLSSNKKKTIRN